MAKPNPKEGRPVGLTKDKRGRPMLVLDNGLRRFIKKADVAMWERRLEGGDGTNMGQGGKKTTTVRHHTKREIDHRPRELGWVLRGFVEHARGVGRHKNPADIFEPPEERDASRDAHEDQLELGRELHELLSAALIHFGITREEWTRWYDASLAKNEYSTKDPLGDPLIDRRVSSSPSAWLPPVQGRVSSRFGAPRDGGARTHEGVDIAVPTGTPIRAPEEMEIVDVGFGERAGRYVIGEIPRPDGSFFDDDRWRVTFAHLSEVHVAEGQRVRRGEVIGLSGATGRVTGPHLHLRTQWVEDVTGPVDDVYSVDPLALIPEQAFSIGEPVHSPGGPTKAIKQGDRVNVIVAPGAGRINVQGHGLPQSDIDVQVPVGGASGGVSASSNPAPEAPQHPLGFISAAFGGPGAAPNGQPPPNPIAGAAQTAKNVLDVAGTAAGVVGPVLQAGGAAAQVGGAITSALGAPQIGAPVAAVGKVAAVAGGAAGVVGAVASPLSELLGPPSDGVSGGATNPLVDLLGPPPAPSQQQPQTGPSPSSDDGASFI